MPGLGWSPGEGKGYPLKYFGLENSMDYIVHEVSKSRTQLSDFHFYFTITTDLTSLQIEAVSLPSKAAQHSTILLTTPVAACFLFRSLVISLHWIQSLISFWCLDFSFSAPALKLASESPAWGMKTGRGPRTASSLIGIKGRKSRLLVLHLMWPWRHRMASKTETLWHLSKKLWPWKQWNMHKWKGTGCW